jgi:hypothetical protein
MSCSGRGRASHRASPLNSVFDGRVKMAMGRRSCLSAAFLLVVPPICIHAREPVPSPSPAVFARCEAEAKSRFNTPAVSGKLPKAGLKKVRGSKAALPELPQGTRGGGIAVHEVLIGPDGKVKSVWSVREPRFEPAFPAFTQAIVAALETWEYEPHRVGGKAAPVCMVVSTNIHWR